MTRERLEPMHQTLDQRAAVIAAGRLPLALLLVMMALMAALRHAAPGMASGHGVAPSRCRIDGCAPVAAIVAWYDLVSYAPSPPTMSTGVPGGNGSSKSGNTSASPTY